MEAPWRRIQYSSTESRSRQDITWLDITIDDHFKISACCCALVSRTYMVYSQTSSSVVFFTVKRCTGALRSIIPVGGCWPRGRSSYARCCYRAPPTNTQQRLGVH
ncbi:unnamed protein product [Ectocarpus fasciculatus]